MPPNKLLDGILSGLPHIISGMCKILRGQNYVSSKSHIHQDDGPRRTSFWLLIASRCLRPPTPPALNRTPQFFVVKYTLNRPNLTFCNINRRTSRWYVTHALEMISWQWKGWQRRSGWMSSAGVVGLGPWVSLDSRAFNHHQTLMGWCSWGLDPWWGVLHSMLNRICLSRWTLLVAEFWRGMVLDGFLMARAWT